MRNPHYAKDAIVVIMRGAVSPDHVHMLLSAPSQFAPSQVYIESPEWDEDEQGFKITVTEH